MIPEEAVEALAKRNYEAEWGDGWDGVIEQVKRGWLNEARAQCEAAAPYIRAQVAEDALAGLRVCAEDNYGAIGFMEGYSEQARAVAERVGKALE